MIEKLYTKAQSLKAQNKSYWNIIYKINKVLVNVFYPITIRFKLNNGIDQNSDAVISLTTYPARVKTVWVTIASLLNQTYKPAKVLLYLSKEQFPNEMHDLPGKLTGLQKKGLDIIFVDGDIKPHKKYYYAFKDYNDKLVMTADDDIFYPENTLETLVASAKEHPNAVICSRSHRISFTKEDGEKNFAPYNSWKNDTTEEPDILSIPVGCNGVLYRPSLFDEEIYSKEHMEKTSLYTDDLWLKIMEVRNDIKAYNCSKEPLIYFDNIFNKGTGLWHANTDSSNNRNDSAWEKLIELYPDAGKKLIGQSEKC